IKKVLAYSTISQLGYMILAMGVGSWVGGLFHLITHAFFKALLFLGSGSVIHAAHHEQELTQYGGLARKIPVTAITFLIGVLAIAGTPLLAGYYSKDMILAHAAALGYLAEGQGRGGLWWAFFVLPVIVAYITAFYMMRCWMLTFWGKPRNREVYEHAHEYPVMYIPLIVLAVLSIIGGSYLGVSDLLQYTQQESNAIVRTIGGDAAGDVFASAWPVRSHDVQPPHEALAVMPATEATETTSALQAGE